MPFRLGLFLAVAIILPTLARGQQSTAGPLSIPQAQRPIAPPALQQVPPGSASTSADERRTMEAVRMAAGESITLDGRLDEDVWMRAVPATNFMQMDPDNGQPATEQTEVRIVYNADKLYMGVTLFDSEPDKLIYYQMGRDGNLPADDKLQWAIDTFNDGRTAYWWEMNPLGSMADALRASNNTNNRQWDGIWDARSTRSEIGWTLEIEVPFRTMNFNPNSDAWGINFQPHDCPQERSEPVDGLAAKPGVEQDEQCRAAHRHPERDPGAWPRREAVPGRARQSRSRDVETPSVTNDAQVGVDLFYNLTPQLRANLTVNTDFAQAEVDARQVNLTRFSLLFPEKRDFFLDGTLVLRFRERGRAPTATGRCASGGDDLIPFFSRRIGLDERGHAAADQLRQQADRAGWRLRHRRLQVQTGEEEDERPSAKTSP